MREKGGGGRVREKGKDQAIEHEAEKKKKEKKN